MTMVAEQLEYVCIEKDQLSNQSRKIAELEARADYKEKRIDELNDKITDMDKKLDILVQGFNDFKMDSKKGDVELELRLKTIETDHDNLKRSLEKKEEENQKRFNNQLAVFAFICAVITLVVNIYFNMH